MLAKIRTKIGQKAQASLEYLLTYGWALILIATIMGILVFIFWTPGGYACSGTGDLICRALGAEGEDLVLSFQNKLPFDIIINPYTGIRFDGRAGYASIKYRGTTYRFEDATIGKGDQFQVTGIGLGDASSISITYKETATGFTKEWTGGTTTPQKEICNNGIDDDGDAKIDCLDTDECEACKYNDGGFNPASTIPATIDPTHSATIKLNSITDLTGAWQMTEAKVYFNATNVSTSPQPTATATYSGKSFSQLVIEGWNEITIDTTGKGYSGSFADFSLSVTAGSFKISGEPKAMATLKRLP